MCFKGTSLNNEDLNNTSSSVIQQVEVHLKYTWSVLQVTWRIFEVCFKYTRSIIQVYLLEVYFKYTLEVYFQYIWSMFHFSKGF